MTSIKGIIGLLKKGDPEKLKEALEKSDDVEDKTSMAQALTDFASDLAYLKGHPHLAIAILLKSLKLNPESSETLYELGNAYSMTEMLEENPKNLDKALWCYDRAIGLNDRNLEARYNKALLLLLTGRKEEARKEYGKLLEYNPDHFKFAELETLLDGREVISV
ncbi:MAG TPA: tetratricopeptide repeat protein [Candidatus Altiarchaeales archaeon]|nr:tetratricopeptide repeat protein [Candidatus Altiarchaeales archaeon]